MMFSQYSPQGICMSTVNSFQHLTQHHSTSSGWSMDKSIASKRNQITNLSRPRKDHRPRYKLYSLKSFNVQLIRRILELKMSHISQISIPMIKQTSIQTNDHVTFFMCDGLMRDLSFDQIQIRST